MVILIFHHALIGAGLVCLVIGCILGFIPMGSGVREGVSCGSVFLSADVSDFLIPTEEIAICDFSERTTAVTLFLLTGTFSLSAGLFGNNQLIKKLSKQIQTTKPKQSTNT